MIAIVFHWMLHVPVLLFCSLLGKYNQIHIKQNSKVVVLAVGPNMCELTSCLSQRGNGYKWIHSKCFAVLQRLSLKSFTWIQLMVSIDRLSGLMQVPTRFKHAEYLSSDIRPFLTQMLEHNLNIGAAWNGTLASVNGQILLYHYIILHHLRKLLQLLRQVDARLAKATSKMWQIVTSTPKHTKNKLLE